MSKNISVQAVLGNRERNILLTDPASHHEDGENEEPHTGNLSRLSVTARRPLRRNIVVQPPHTPYASRITVL